MQLLLSEDTGTVFRWYQQYQQEGEQGLEPQPSKRRQFWNGLPEAVCDRIVQLALARPEKSARQLAWPFTDQEDSFSSESSVFRLLKRFDLVESPAFQRVTAPDRFAHPTHRVNELWQTDFTYFTIQGRGWYYPSTVLDDYSRCILAWKLTPTMEAADVQETHGVALARRLGPGARPASAPAALGQRAILCVWGDAPVSREPADRAHPRGALPSDDTRQDRALPPLDEEPWAVQTFSYPRDLEQEITRFVDYYNSQWYHESLDNVTPADVYFGRAKGVQSRREEIKRRTLETLRRQETQLLRTAALRPGRLAPTGGGLRPRAASPEGANAVSYRDDRRGR